MPMSPKLLRPRASGTAIHSEAVDWAARVTANGGTVSSNTLAAVSTFCATVNLIGVRSKLYRVNLFAGNELAAALVPLYTATSTGGTNIGFATDTNNGFVSADYAETGTSGGIRKSSGSKNINTGARNLIPASDFAHLGVSIVNGSILGFGPAVAIGPSGTGRCDIWTNGSGSPVSLAASPWFSDSGSNQATGSSYARWLVSRTSLSLARMFRNGVANTSDTTTRTYTPATVNPAHTLTVLGEAANAFSLFGVHYYTFGASLTDQQAAEYDAAFSVFLQQMGRS